MKRGTMKRFRCPKCLSEMETIGNSVGHRCTKNLNKWTEYELIDREQGSLDIASVPTTAKGHR